MGKQQIVLEQGFEIEECCNCGIAFAMPSTLVRRLKETHNWFYCPNGHAQHYTAESEAEKLRRELAQEQNRRLSVINELQVALQAKAQLEKRIARGVCPCCKRSFHNLQRHMKTQHAEFSRPDRAIAAGKPALPN